MTNDVNRIKMEKHEIFTLKHKIVVVHINGVRLCLWTAATKGSIVHLPDNKLPSKCPNPCSLICFFICYVPTLTRSRLVPVILMDWLPTVTVYLYSPREASFVEKLWRSADRRTPTTQNTIYLPFLAAYRQFHTLYHEGFEGLKATVAYKLISVSFQLIYMNKYFTSYGLSERVTRIMNYRPIYVIYEVYKWMFFAYVYSGYFILQSFKDNMSYEENICNMKCFPYQGHNCIHKHFIIHEYLFLCIQKYKYAPITLN
jgi:hypothetical protein